MSSLEISGAPLENTAVQLVHKAFQLRVVQVLDTVDTLVSRHDFEERQRIFGKTRDCRGDSQVSQDIRDKLHISVFQRYLKRQQILLRHDHSHCPIGHGKLALQQTG